MRFFRVTLTMFASLGLLALPTPSIADHTWGNYHWSITSSQLYLDLGNNLENNWVEYLNTATSDWEVSRVLGLTVVEGSTNSRRCKAQSGNVQVCNLAYGNNGWLGIAGISVSGGHITAGYVKLNDTYFNTSFYNTPAWRRLVMCQEIGHTFGLDHQDETFNNANLGTCMDYTNNPEGPLSNEHPDTHDYELLENVIYNHTHSISGGGNDSGCNPRKPFCNNSGLSAAEVLSQIDTNN
ncbi:MAG: hypothetical protein K9K86_10220, partial [Pseudomonadales bacterium]|nr:hypothetical protein [Pseudomonadales bacterium]